jgi:hypothetical protein
MTAYLTYFDKWQLLLHYLFAYIMTVYFTFFDKWQLLLHYLFVQWQLRYFTFFVKWQLLSHSVSNDSLFRIWCRMRAAFILEWQLILHFYIRPYPMSTAGRPHKLSFDVYTKIFNYQVRTSRNRCYDFKNIFAKKFGDYTCGVTGKSIKSAPNRGQILHIWHKILLF